MNRIPSAFHMDETGRATIRPAFDWFAQGRGFATRKWDGEPRLIIKLDGDIGLTCFRGIRFAAGLPTPKGFIPTTPEGAEEVCGWAPSNRYDENWMAVLESMRESGYGISEVGTYELCGPKIKGNHEGLSQPTIFKHDLITYLRCPRTLDELVWFMLKNPSEGIVWTYGDAMCKLTRQDVGLPWPLEEDGASE